MADLILPANPRASYLAHREAIDAAIARVLGSGRYILDREVASFEGEFASYLGARHAVGVASGTDALRLALEACGVGPGDAVLTVSHTAAATAAAIAMCGAEPVFVDIDPLSYTMDPESLEAAIRAHGSLSLKAVVPVHLYGHPADMDAIAAVARRRGLRVVEDCAQSHGASYRGRKTGTLGDAAAFSFYPTKNLGALGDGGMVTTDDPALAERVRLLREYGWKRRYVSEVPGVNSRLDELQAAVLRAKLPGLDAGNEARRALAAIYDSGLSATGLSLPRAAADVVPVWHQYVIRAPGRDGLIAQLRENGVVALVHYPVPVHGQPAYRGRPACPGGLPRTDEAVGRIVSLPIHPELDPDDARKVCRLIAEWRVGRTA